jgi:23S rRNA-/tRNA-specific pseudouridylate synthase
LVRDNARRDQPKALVDAAGKPACSEYEVLQRGRGRALLRLVLRTGRTHQLRAHLSHIGPAIVGDRRYGARGGAQLRGFLLHAERLAFAHPINGASIDLVEAAPASWREELGPR